MVFDVSVKVYFFLSFSKVRLHCTFLFFFVFSLQLIRDGILQNHMVRFPCIRWLRHANPNTLSMDGIGVIVWCFRFHCSGFSVC